MSKNKLIALLEKDKITFESDKIKYINPKIETFDPWTESNFLFHINEEYKSEQEFRILYKTYPNHGMRAYRCTLKDIARAKKYEADIEECRETYDNDRIFKEFNQGKYIKFLSLLSRKEKKGIRIPLDITPCIEEICCLNNETKEKILKIFPDANIQVK